jgi:hypothetical protein
VGHDVHFLERLDRVTGEESDVALSLYRDHVLVSHILQIAKPPDGADRIAISIAHPTEGPFIIVTRDGHFVTCLGRGMKPKHFVITRDRLDTITAQLATFRARSDRASAATGASGTDALIRSISAKADTLSREDVDALLAIAPILGEVFLTVFVKQAMRLDELRSTLMEVDGVRRKVDRDLLLAWWGLLAAQSNLVVLLGSADRERLDDIGARFLGAGMSPTWHLTSYGVFGITARAIWFAARGGRSFLPLYKDRLEAAADISAFFDAVRSLWAMSVRHKGLRAEIMKALRPNADDSARQAAFAAFRGEMASLVERAEAPDVEQHLLEIGAEETLERIERMPEDASFRSITRIEDVPLDLARTSLLTLLWDTLDVQAMGARALDGATPFIARASATDFFYPETFARALGSLGTAQTALAFARNQRVFRAEKKPVVAQPTPGRNDPCTCGSGKKWKRCCGA